VRDAGVGRVGDFGEREYLLAGNTPFFPPKYPVSGQERGVVPAFL